MHPSFLNTASATSTIFDWRRLKFYWIDASNSKICSKKLSKLKFKMSVTKVWNSNYNLLTQHCICLPRKLCVLNVLYIYLAWCDEEERNIAKTEIEDICEASNRKQRFKLLDISSVEKSMRLIFSSFPVWRIICAWACEWEWELRGDDFNWNFK